MDASGKFAGTATVRKMRSSMAPPRRQRGRTVRGKQGLGAGPAATGAGGGAGADSEKETDKHAMCVEILTAGFVQSYVDFFYLTHRPDPNPDPVEDPDADKEIKVGVDDMTFIKDNLTTAEASRRKGDTARVYECYNNLARYFQGAKDSKTGIYFYEKCLEIARLTGDVSAEMAANHNLGVAYTSLGNVNNAIKFHERHLELAQAQESPAEQKAAHSELVTVYRQQATALEADKQLAGAAELHLRCLLSAQACGDRLAEGLANYRTGRVHVLLEEPAKAIPYLTNYLSITEEVEGQEEGQGSAHAALAAAYQALEQPDKAVAELEQFLKIADATSNVAAQSEACSNLGVIYNRRGDFPQAVKYFERAYELVRALLASGEGTRRQVDGARVNLGMARGNARMGSYLNVINYDVKALLLWKNRRVLPSGSAAAGSGKGAGAAAGGAGAGAGAQ